MCVILVLGVLPLHIEVFGIKLLRQGDRIEQKFVWDVSYRYIVYRSSIELKSMSGIERIVSSMK
jgi:hypothetical protein